jgi:hypothetical protein
MFIRATHNQFVLVKEWPAGEALCGIRRKGCQQILTTRTITQTNRLGPSEATGV